MSAAEYDLNKKDLNAYVSGDYKTSSMLPGQPSPHTKGDKISKLS